MRKKRWLWGLVALGLCMSSCTGRGSREETAPTPEPTAAPTPESSPVPVMETDPVERRMAEMTLREMVGQLFIVRPDALIPGKPQEEIDGEDENPVTEVTEELRSVLRAYPVGGVAVFGKNIVSPGQFSALLAGLQASSELPLLIGADEEGGAVARLAGNPAFGLPRYESAAAVGRSGRASAALEMGHTIGRYLHCYGVHIDFAPVADVNTNPDNPIIGSRAFSSDPRLAAEMVGAFAEGLKQESVIPTLKHFPGHGDTAEDSHDGVAVSAADLSALERCEWLPYLQNDLSGCAVMVGHIALPAVTGDMTPASLSYEIVTGCLRERVGFEGLVLTDSLAMHAIADNYAPGDAAVAAVLAGCDVILMPKDLADSFEAVVDAAERGIISRDRLEQSVRRILEYKLAAGLPI